MGEILPYHCATSSRNPWSSDHALMSRIIHRYCSRETHVDSSDIRVGPTSGGTHIYYLWDPQFYWVGFMIKNLCLRSIPHSGNFTKTTLNFAEIVFTQSTSQVSLKELKWRGFSPPHWATTSRKGESFDRTWMARIIHKAWWFKKPLIRCWN
jgi:hypothetical protein